MTFRDISHVNIGVNSCQWNSPFTSLWLAPLNGGNSSKAISRVRRLRLLFCAFFQYSIFPTCPPKPWRRRIFLSLPFSCLLCSIFRFSNFRHFSLRPVGPMARRGILVHFRPLLLTFPVKRPCYHGLKIDASGS